MRTHLLAPALVALILACSGASSDSTDPSTGGTDDPTATGDVPTTGSDVPTTGGPLCGNAMIDGGEDCDGAELGGMACADVDPATPNGALACAANCKFDSSGCAAAGGAFIALNEVTSLGADVGPFAGLGDAIELYNPGDAAIDLSGWQMSDAPALPVDKTYVFPPGTTLAPGEYLVLTAYDDVALTGDFPFGLSSSNEETLTLADADGAQVDQVIFSGADATLSYCRLPDGTGAWQLCDSTLGGANIAASMICGNGTREGTEPCEGADLGGATCETLGYAGGALSCTATCTFETGMCTSPSAVILNELESTDDQIEVFNSSDMPVDISGWILTDDPGGDTYDPALDLEKLVFPPMSTLPANTYLVVPKGDLPGQHPFGLSASGDTVTLLQADLTFVDQVTYGAQLASVSYCRIPDGPGNPWVADCVPTFGAPNTKP
jgi:hypothetical protein